MSVGGDAIGKVNLSVKNGTLSTNSVWVEQDKQTVTVKAGASGQVVVTATPEKGFSDADANEYHPGAKSVTVSVVSGSSNSKPSSPSQSTKPSTNTQKPSGGEQKSSNNLLSSLKMSSGELSPKFSQDVLEYSVNFSHDVSTITISAIALDEKAKIEGLGEKKLTVGENKITVVVTAENGEKKTYQITAFVEETPKVYLSYLNEEIGVLNSLKAESIPKGFEKKEFSKDDQTISVFSNGTLSIIYGINANQEKGFYLFDENSVQCSSKFLPVKLLNQEFYLVDLEDLEGFEKATLEVNQQVLSGYEFNLEMGEYFLLSFLNSNGESVKYLYEKSEGTLQRYSNQALSFYQEQHSLQEALHRQQILFGVISILFLICVCLLSYFLMKRKGKNHEKMD